MFWKDLEGYYINKVEIHAALPNGFHVENVVKLSLARYDSNGEPEFRDVYIDSGEPNIDYETPATCFTAEEIAERYEGAELSVVEEL